jgi:hypothetical protein
LLSGLADWMQQIPTAADLPPALNPLKWPPNTLLSTSTGPDGFQVKLHPLSDPRVSADMARGAMADVLRLELSRHILPKGFQREVPSLYGGAEFLDPLITSINAKRKRFPSRIETAFTCFKLKRQKLPNGRFPTNEQIGHMMEEFVDVQTIKRYGREIRALVENGCPW